MNSRYYQYPPRGAAFDPRHSMPNVPNYAMYPQDDITVTPVVVPPRSQGYRHAHTGSLSRPATLYDNPRTSMIHNAPPRRDRSSTIDSSHQPPIIITTTDRRGHAPPSSGGRSGSPVRHEHHYSEASLYAPPSMSRSRSANRAAHSPVFPLEDFSRAMRPPDGLLDPARSDAYRSTRPSVVFPTSPHRTTPLNIEENYGYTKPSDLARYDLEHHTLPASRRRESMDNGYARPNVFYQSSRGLTVETNRTHEHGPRTFDNRGGPPPSTRGFDRLNRYDPPPHAPAPPSLDVPPSPIRERRGSNRLARPVSLYQEVPPRHDEYYRLREDERNRRQIDDLDRESQHHANDGFHDDGVGVRGFGLRTDTYPAAVPVDDRRERRERARREMERGPEEPRRRSDESLDRDSGRNGEHDKQESRRSRQKLAREDAKDRLGSKEDEEEKSKGFRDTMKAGFGAAAAAVGLGGLKDADKEDDDKEKRNRRESDEKRDSSDDVEIVGSRAAKSYRSGDKEYISGSFRRDRRERKDPPPDVTDVHEQERREREEARERHRRAAEARINGDRGESSRMAARESSESSDERERAGRRRRRSHSFNPNDANSLKEIKDQLAAQQVEKRQADKDKERKDGKEKEPALIVDAPVEARRPSTREPSPQKRRDEDNRGRDLAPPAHEERQVRVVSPPREKHEPKPIKGILKQPSAKFPEDPNPIREGVAPHKTDEKLKEVPPDARWTKISRKIVNPEALTIGKERFEERDDFVVVLRVLNKEEIQAYADATAVLRERRREAARDKEREYYGERDEKRSSRRHHHRDRDRDWDDDDEIDERERRHRRHKIDDDEEENERGGRRQEHYHHKRHRDREYAVED